MKKNRKRVNTINLVIIYLLVGFIVSLLDFLYSCFTGTCYYSNIGSVILGYFNTLIYGGWLEIIAWPIIIPLKIFSIIQVINWNS
jgi:hypothetical protein